jgi:hypothetical protein
VVRLFASARSARTATAPEGWDCRDAAKQASKPACESGKPAFLHDTTYDKAGIIIRHLAFSSSEKRMPELNAQLPVLYSPERLLFS